MKYLLMGGISSFILACGFSWLYGLFSEETQFQEVISGLINMRMYNSLGALIGLVCIVVGIRFKLSLTPFHQWTLCDSFHVIKCNESLPKQGWN